MTQQPPMLRQYRTLKARYPDALLLFRLGDFYELFEEDARIAARELGLVLTRRRFSKTIRLPMCGVPYRSVTNAVARLLEKGYKVVIAEQMEKPGKGRRLVRREVVRVITPGTVVEETLLPEKGANYLVAIALREDPRRGRAYGLAAVDLSTGEFTATEMTGPEADTHLREELGRLRPSELLLPEPWASSEGPASEAETSPPWLQEAHPVRLSSLPAADFDPDLAAQRLRDHFGVASLEAYGLDGHPLALAAAGATLHYLKANQLSELAHLRRLSFYDVARFMHLDATTRRNLELTETLREGRTEGSLFHVLDFTKTAMGGRLLRRWIHQPLLDLEAIEARQGAVASLVDDPLLRADLRELLDGLHDLERLVGRIGFGNANARDLVALRRALARIPRLQKLLEGRQVAPPLRALLEGLEPLPEVSRLITQAIVEHPPILVREGGLIRAGYHPELDALRRTAAQGRDWLAAYEAQERERTGIPNLRIKYNEVFGFFIEVTRSHLSKVPPEYERRATITHAERFITPALKEREAEILAAEERAKELEYDLFVQVRRRVAAHADRLTQVARRLAELDALASLAEAAARYGYIRPTVDGGTRIEVREGRHPVVERTLPEGERFVPNDTLLDGEANRLLIITGPNMAGKSVYIRQVALIVLMAQMGSFVPAASAHVGLADRIFVRAGASDDIAQGRSTFLVEMSETSYILHHATARSLVVLDEVGRGTSTYDGLGLAWAVAEELHDRIGARTLFATHFHELTELADHLEGARNYSLAVREQGDRVIFLRRLVPGGTDRSFGIQVARLAGLPERVVERALEVLERLQGERVRLQQEAGKAAAVQPAPLREREATYLTDLEAGGLLVPTDDAAVWAVVREMLALDIGNTTPVEALVALNRWQQRLKASLPEQDWGGKSTP